jgi:hypothetical protein
MTASFRFDRAMELDRAKMELAGMGNASRSARSPFSDASLN